MERDKGFNLKWFHKVETLIDKIKNQGRIHKARYKP